LWPQHAGFQLSLNEGALFGLGQGGAGLFAVGSVAAAVAIPAWLFLFGAARDLKLTLVLAAIMGGVLGNLYDRLGLHGLEWGAFDPKRAGEPVYAVRDFVLLAWKWDAHWQNRVVWPNFNLADSLLVCGAAALVILSFKTPKGAEQPPSDRAATESEAAPS
jgi:signal peptidase II